MRTNGVVRGENRWLGGWASRRFFSEVVWAIIFAPRETASGVAIAKTSASSKSAFNWSQRGSLIAGPITFIVCNRWLVKHSTACFNSNDNPKNSPNINASWSIWFARPYQSPLSVLIFSDYHYHWNAESQSWSLQWATPQLSSAYKLNRPMP